MIFKIDSFILERIFTPFAWWIERRFNHTNFFLAWWAYGFSILSLMVYLGLEVLHPDANLSTDIIFVPVMVGISYLTVSRLQELDRRAKTQPQAIVLRASRPGAEILRVGGLIIGFYNLFSLFPKITTAVAILVEPELTKQFFWGASFLLIDCAFYFGSVRRPPPKPHREEVPEGRLASAKA